MKPQAIRATGSIRRSVEKARKSYARKIQKLTAAQSACDHHYANGRSALKSVSTHDPATCGGYKDCVVCAGERPESEFVRDECQICGKTVPKSS